MKDTKDNKKESDVIVIPLNHMEISQLKDGTEHIWKYKNKDDTYITLKIKLSENGDWEI